MAETHLLQHLAAFVLAMWWTKQWLISRPVSRWRFAVSALSGAILWVFVAYTSTSSLDTSGGVTIEFQSMALAYFSAFMAFVSVVGIFLGLLLWTDEEAREAGDDVPSYLKSNLSDD